MSKAATSIIGAIAPVLGIAAAFLPPPFDLIGFVALAALGTGASLLAPKPGTGGEAASSFEAEARSRTTQIREAVTHRRLYFGEVIIAGKVSRYEASAGNTLHHMIITLGDAPVAPWAGIDFYWLDDTPVFLHQIDSGSGAVTAGRFAGDVWIKPFLGGPDQELDLYGEFPDLPPDFKGRGIAGVYLKVRWSQAKFPRGLPELRAFARTNQPLDTRDGQRRFTSNAALCLHEFLTIDKLGLGYVAGEDLATAYTDAAANVSDEIVDAKAVGTVVAGRAGDQFGMTVAGDGAPLRMQTGDRVELFTDGTLPGGLATETDYYIIVDNLVGANDKSLTIPLDAGDFTGLAAQAITAGLVDNHHGGDANPGGRFAASYDDALARQAIAISSDGTGTTVIIKTGEPRYRAAGLITLDTRPPREHILDLLSAMAGRLTWTGAEFRILPGAWREPTLDLDLDDVWGPISTTTKVSQRDRFNAVKGLFAAHISVGEVTDYPPVIDQAYVTADKGRKLFADLPQPFTPTPGQAQRVAKIQLARHRREIAVSFPTLLKGWDAEPGTTLRFSNARRGWVDKTFEVGEQQDVEVQAGDPPLKGVQLLLDELDATAFDFDPDSDETIKPPKRLPPGGNPLTVAVPGVPMVSESTFVTRDGAGVKALATIAWGAADDAFVIEYQVEARRLDGAGGSPIESWKVLGRTAGLEFEFRDVAPGIWEFQVKAINHIGAESDYVLREAEILGLPAAPQQLQSLSIGAVGGLALIRWTQSPDLDVRIGGHILIRHSPLQSGVAWATSARISEAVPGQATETLLPLKPGSYVLRARDSSGTLGPIATVSTKGAQVIAFANVDALQEDPGFTGTHDDTVVVDSTLRLDTDGSAVLPEGTYTFAAGLDFGSVIPVRLRSELQVVVVNTDDLFDSHPGLFDDGEGLFDGDDAGLADAVVEVRFTDDDPAGSPTWSPWEVLHSMEIEARAIDAPRVRLTSSDSTYNIHVSQLRVTADEVS